MANARTLAQLRASVQYRGQYENSSDITATLLNEFINEAIAETYDILTMKWQDYYTVSVSPATVINTEAVALPSDFYKLRKVEILTTNGRYRRMLPHDLEASHLYSANVVAKHYRYRLQAANLIIVPTPQAVETLRLYYIPYAPRLVGDSDTFDGINNYEELVIQHAVRRCKMREELPTGDILQEIERLTERVRTAADSRDASEPFYLEPKGPPDEGSDDDDWW